MTTDKFGWLDDVEAKNNEERSKGYFQIVEGDNKFVLLSHFARLELVWDGSKYRVATEDDQNVSIKGVCWVLQDGLIKEATLPYTVMKDIRALSNNSDWDFEIPFPHMLTLNAKGAGTKEVVYSLTPSPKKTQIPRETLDELAKKLQPEEVVEKIKEAKAKSAYPTAESEGIKPEDTPFN